MQLQQPVEQSSCQEMPTIYTEIECELKLMQEQIDQITLATAHNTARLLKRSPSVIKWPKVLDTRIFKRRLVIRFGDKHIVIIEGTEESELLSS